MATQQEPSKQTNVSLIPPPEWLPDLILYEIATKGFTSPAGPESGTFESLRARLPYLKDLGITGIWLTGHSLADPDHFYNIWTQYAVVRPDVIDPSLGSEDDLRALVAAAHDHGIKVLLEVVTHGVMNDSPLVQEKPHWFKGGSWGMTDFDWAGHHPDLDDWWVEMWVHAVEHYGVDGFRLDVATYRFDLWQRIRQRAAELGHNIVVIAENGPGCAGVVDFLQRGAFRLSNQTVGLNPESPLLKDVASFIQAAVRPHSTDYSVKILGDDGSTVATGSGETSLRITATNVRPEPVEDATGTARFVRHLVELDVAGLPPGYSIQDIHVRSANGQEWRLRPWVEIDYLIDVADHGDFLRLSFPEQYPPGHWLAVQLSSHDDGWDGFPLGKNPYVAQGSRFVFGYGCLLAPCVPLFMAGEEFNAAYRPLPQLSPRLFGGEGFGEGRWLYGSWLQWEQLEMPEHASMLRDVQRLIAIRRRVAHLIRPLRVGDSSDHLLPVQATADRDIPVPYLYRGDGECILVAGNPDPMADVRVHCRLPVDAMGADASTVWTIRDLWQDSAPYDVRGADLERVAFTVPADGRAGGGLRVLHFQRKE